MSAAREKDQADFDLETFVDLFDTAMSSDNPAVKKALKNLILISAMVNAESASNGLSQGPLRRLVDDVKNLNRRINSLESATAYRSTQVPNTTTTPWTVTPGVGTSPANPGQWHPNTNTWPTINPNSIPPGTIIGGSSAVYSENNIKLNSLLDKLETK